MGTAVTMLFLVAGEGGFTLKLSRQGRRRGAGGGQAVEAECGPRSFIPELGAPV